ncbi:MAG TPA: nucleotidyltransferase family protein [Tepidisphaeraceae bacterium]|nr:nucleotidyltransferase family protein [Tepidisphaeraceae bacterium]
MREQRPGTEGSSVAAIVPAAGRSGRMGTPKQLLDLDGKPMLLGIVEALLAGGAARVTVVASSPLLQKFPAFPSAVTIAINDDPQTEMIDSIRIGLAASVGFDGYLVCPSDAAKIAAADVRRCIDAFTATPDRIVIATHNGRRGHPLLFPASLAAVVHASECDAGLNQLARNRPQLVREVKCDSAGTITNVNTPADYEKLR